MENRILGMSKEEYNKQASAHSKANIFLWIVGGVVYSIYIGTLFSITTLLLLIPGIFIVSFFSLFSFLVNLKKNQIVPRTENVFILFAFTVWYVIDLIFPVILSIYFVKLVNHFLF